MRENYIYIIGGGLSGLAAAIALAKTKCVQVTILEQGAEYSMRLDRDDSDKLCGLGGAGTLGGGKLCFPPASGGIWKKTKQYSSCYMDFMQEYFMKEIAERYKTNSLFLRSDKEGLQYKRYDSWLFVKSAMKQWVSGLISQARELGVNIRCNCEFLNYKKSSQGYIVCFNNEEGCVEKQSATYLLLATGRISAKMLNKGIAQKNAGVLAPDLGIRLSLDRNEEYIFSEVGKDIKLKANIGKFYLRTFCVCSGGDSVIVRNGRNEYYDGHFGENITNIANLGLLARSKVYQGPDVANNYLSAMQKYVNAEMSLKDFVNYRKLIARNTAYEDLFEAIVEFIERLQGVGYLTQNIANIPVMIPSVDRFNALVSTDGTFETNQRGIFVIGDAAGVSRGFVQAMWSGFCAAKRIEQRMMIETENRSVI